MPAQNQNVEVYQSDDTVIRIVVRDALGQPVDLTGATAKWKVAQTLSDGTPRTNGVAYIEKSSPSDGIVLTLADGVWSIVITLEPEDTASMYRGTYYHELEIVDVTGKQSTVTVGRFVLRPTTIRP